MPGYDGTGPRGAGARTGRRRGRRARWADESGSVEDPYQYYGVGWGYWPWDDGGVSWDDGGVSSDDGRRRRFRGGGKNRGRGFGRARRAIEDPAGPDGTRRLQETFLKRREEALTAELDRVRALLSDSSRAGAEDGG